jgi:hypothetical protein
MNSTIATQPSIHHPSRRALLSAAVAATLAFGAGAALVRLTSTNTTSRPTHAATAPLTAVDVRALWNNLATLSTSEREQVVAGLAPEVRAALSATARTIATAALASH